MAGKIDGGHYWALKECLKRALRDMQGQELKDSVKRYYAGLCESFSIPNNLDPQIIESWVEEQMRLWAQSLEQEEIK